MTRGHGYELMRGVGDPTPFPGYIGHRLRGNSAALVLSQHETLRDLGVLNRFQQPVQFFSIHDALLSSPLTIRLSLLDVVHDIPGVNTGRDEFRAFFA